MGEPLHQHASVVLRNSGNPNANALLVGLTHMTMSCEVSGTLLLPTGDSVIDHARSDGDERRWK